MTDDFWGEAEWQAFAEQIKKVFPELDIFEIPLEHEIFHTWYDMKEKPQVPNITAGMESRFTGVTWERGADSQQPHYRGLADSKGRLMAIFCHNTDLADGWERDTVDKYYFEQFSQKKAYPMGMIIVIYALTH